MCKQCGGCVFTISKSIFVVSQYGMDLRIVLGFFISMRVDLSVGRVRCVRWLRFDGIGARAVTIGDRERDGGARPGRRVRIDDR